MESEGTCWIADATGLQSHGPETDFSLHRSIRIEPLLIFTNHRGACCQFRQACRLCRMSFAVKLTARCIKMSSEPLNITRSPAVARMADRNAPVIKLTLTLTLVGHNLAKTGTSHLKGPIMRQSEAHRVIFCTSKTTSGFIYLLPVV